MKRAAQRFCRRPGASVALLAVALLVAAPAASASGVSLVRDIKPGHGGSHLGTFTNVGGTLFFSADDATHGRELWRSDGTAAGTRLVKDINPGGKGSQRGYTLWTNVGGTLFFTANDGTHGDELWRSNGTRRGTRLVKDIKSGGKRGSSPNALTNLGGTLLFSADDGTHGDELWRSNGTRKGTRLVKDIWPRRGGSYPGFFDEQLTKVGRKLFFSADDSTHGDELWRSNGTRKKTRLVRDVKPGTRGSYPRELTNGGGSLFFSANDGTHGVEPWRSNGTRKGTRLVKDINPGGKGSWRGSTGWTNVGGTLFFTADDGTHGDELWRSNGPRRGTRLVKDINPINPGRGPSYSKGLTDVGGTLFFSVSDNIHSVGDADDTYVRELWRSDGTAAGTRLVKRYPERPGLCGNGGPDYLTNVRSTLFFNYGLELWRSDGTGAGTTPVKCFPYSPAYEWPDPPSELTDVGGTLFFIANDGTHGSELWKAVP